MHMSSDMETMARRHRARGWGGGAAHAAIHRAHMQKAKRQPASWVRVSGGRGRQAEALFQEHKLVRGQRQCVVGRRAGGHICAQLRGGPAGVWDQERRPNVVYAHAHAPSCRSNDRPPHPGGGWRRTRPSAATPKQGPHWLQPRGEGRETARRAQGRGEMGRRLALQASSWRLRRSARLGSPCVAGGGPAVWPNRGSCPE